MSCLKACCVSLPVGIGIGVVAWTVSHRRPDPMVQTVKWQSPQIKVADGVIYHYFAEGSTMVRGTKSDAIVLDLDLARSPCQLEIAASDVKRRKGGKLFGAALTVRDWCEKRNAIGGINGGFFGDTDGLNRQIEGLFILKGHVYNSGKWIKSTRKHESYVRSAFGLEADGTPHIGWATVSSSGALKLYSNPIAPAKSTEIKVASAIACGPRLLRAGEAVITDGEERLVSNYALPRTFVAYSRSSKSGGRPKHVILGIAMEMTYEDVARFVRNYFVTEYNETSIEAMCLDGGASTQLAFRIPEARESTTEKMFQDTRPSLVPVPTAVLIRPR